MSYLNSILNDSKKFDNPFEHWELNNPLTDVQINEIDSADITDLDSQRRNMNDDLKQKNTKVTFLPFLLKATVDILKSMPELNSSLNHTGETLIMKHYYNIGIAVDTPNGLVVPVIMDVDSKSILQLSEELTILSENARS